MKKLNTIGALALLLVFSALFALSAPAAVHARSVQPSWTVPAGFNEHDYNACVSFFETTDENGLKNGLRMDPGYDPGDPNTWISIDELNDIFVHVHWITVDGEFRLWRIDVAWLDAVGVLDLADCPALEYIEATGNRLTAINTHGCGALRELYCDRNGLGSIDVSENPLLYQLWCDRNGLVELDLSNNPLLHALACNGNLLSELDLSNQRGLDALSCGENLLTELDLSSNPELTMLWCPENRLERLDLSANTKLNKLFAANNALTELELGSNTVITLIDCMNNRIASLDVSSNTALSELNGAGNAFTHLKLNSRLCADTVRAEGGGSFGYHCSVPYSEGFVSARADEGSVFVGWFDQSGAFITASPYIVIWNTEYTELTARFTPAAPLLPGDADGSGSVNIADAVLTMRYAMGLIGAESINLINADADNNGSVNIADAIRILRTAMGL
ncbi:MAG: hypothetical protein IKI64_00320 [Clostridia bacterium]|nr:hypothetical protein [Clostridia bacterium]